MFKLVTIDELYDIIKDETINVNGWFRGFKSLKSTIKNLKNNIVISFNNDDKIILNQSNDKINMFINKKLVYTSNNIDLEWIIDIYKEYLKNKGWKQID